ncbi:MAG: response regulator [Myxococcales bacterium]|nr:response regulator [Myxococcales bacterium]
MFLLGRCAAAVAHEVNNPLSAVTANISHVNSSLDSAALVRHSLKEALDDAMTGAVQVSRIVMAFRALARSDPHLGRPVDEVVRYAEILTSHPIRASAAVRVQLHGGTDGPVPRLAGDSGLLLQALVNLLLHSADHMPPGVPAPEVAVAVHANAVPVTLTVTSTGPASGVDPEGPDPTEPSVWMAQQLLAEIAGTLTIADAEGGCVYTLTAPEYGAPPLEPPAPPPDLGRASVLVIDDNELVATSLKRMLASDFDVQVASNGMDALQCLSRAPLPDVVLCDLMMPGLTGEQLFSRVSEDLRRRFIFLTGGFTVGSTRRFLREHDVPCLEKPFERSALLAHIQRVVATAPSAIR